MLLWFTAISVLHRLLPQYVHLRVTDDEDVAVHRARAADISLEFKLNSIFCVHKARAAAVQCLICHGAEINQKPELVIGVELHQIHVRRFIFCLNKEVAGLHPNVLAFDAAVVQHFGRAVQRDADLRQVRVEVLF